MPMGNTVKNKPSFAPMAYQSFKTFNMSNLTLLSEDEGENNVIPPFPYEVFPEQIREIIQVNCNTLSLNIDYCSITILFTVATAMGTNYTIKVKNGWEEMAILFCALVGKSGINKSAPLSNFTKPLEDYNNHLFENYIKEYETYKNQKKQSKDGVEMLDEPVYKQKVVKETTPEALYKAFYVNQHGLGGIYDELPSLVKGFNKYNNGGGDEEQLLSIFSGKSISVNRKNSPPLLIKKPFLCIIGGIQRKILIDIFGKNRIENGFTPRFLFAYPDQVLRQDLSEKDVPEELMVGYKTIIDSILHNRVSNDNLNGRTVKFSSKAFECYCIFRRRLDEIINTESRDAICGIYSKLDIYFIRISLVLHVMGIACGEISKDENEVSPTTTERAEKIIDYFEKTALKVYNLMARHSDPLSDYTQETKVFYYSLPEKFTTSVGEAIAEKKSIKRRTFFNLLRDDYLFTKTKYKEYEKNF